MRAWSTLKRVLRRLYVRDLLAPLAVAKRARAQREHLAFRQTAALRALIANPPDATAKSLQRYFVDVADASRKGLAADRVAIWMRDTTGRLVELQAVSEVIDTIRPVHNSLPIDQPRDLLDALVARGVMVTNDASRAPHLRSLYASMPALNVTHSRIDAGISIDGELAGLLVASTANKSADWSDRDAQFVKEIATLVSLGVERRDRKAAEAQLFASNTRLLAELERRNDNDITGHRRQKVLADLIRAADHPTSELSVVAQQIADELRHELGVDRVAMWRRSAKSDYHPLSVSDCDPSVQPIGPTTTAPPIPSYVQAMLRGEPLLADDVSTAPHLVDTLALLPHARAAKSRLDVPILRDGRLDGKIICSSRSLRRWTQDDAMFAAAVGNVVSILMERRERIAFEGQLIEVNTRLVDEADRRDGADRKVKQRQALLSALIRTIGAEADNGADALQSIVEDVRFELGVERVAVWLISETDTGRVGTTAAVADLNPQQRDGVQHVSEAVLPDYFAALATGEPLVASDAAAAAHLAETMPLVPKLLAAKSRLDLPLMRDGRLTGAMICAARSNAHEWSQEDTLFGVAVAGVISILLEQRERRRAERSLVEAHQQLLAESQRREANHIAMKANQDALTALVQQASDASRPVTDTYQSLVDQVRLSLHAEVVSLWLGTIKDPTCTIAAVSATVDTGIITAGRILPTPTAPGYYAALDRGEPLATGTVTREPYLAELIEVFPAVKREAARIDIPIMHGGRLVGMLIASTVKATRLWTREELLFCSAIAGVTSVLIERQHRQQVELDLRRANTEIGAANRAKSLFLANMSHEIRTPMNGVFGMTDLLLRTDLTTRQTRLVETISQSARTLLTIINDILDLSRIEAGKLELDPRDIDLHTTIEGVIELMVDDAQKKGLDLSLYFAPSVPRGVVGDAARLRQICLNLIGNAVKFTQQGQVAVRVSASDVGSDTSALIVEVSDTGIGISPDLQSRLFQPFAQGDSSISRRFGGTGLGLSISMHLAQLMGGQVTLASEPGRGTTVRFEVSLPRAALSTVTVARSANLASKRILVIDDRDTNREIVTSYLTEAGALCTAVGDADAALREIASSAAEHAPFAAVVVDMVMPSTDGLTLARLLRADPQHASLGIVMVTSLSWKGDQRSVRALGVQALLTKPVRRDDLISCVSEAIRTSREPDVAPSGERATDSAAATRLSGHVLIAEDNPVNVEVASEYLSQLGLTFDVVENGGIAVDMVAARTYDLVLMDCQMPDVDGFEATRRIRQIEQVTGGRRLPIVAITANAYERDRIACLDAGMDDYISKPFTEQTLASCLSRWLVPSSTLVEVSDGGRLDMRRLAELRAVRATLLPRITAAYLSHSPRLIAELTEAAATGNVAMLQTAAHSFKSSSANLGATRLAALCAELESGVHLHNQADAVIAVRDITVEFRAVGQALEAELDRVAS